ncbi:MAG: DoxX family protein [Candidatus Magasanikbacteria bacterium RIFCSPHIGHO2_02_FULL_47_14]|uniref:DoxX family protein n=1 Tax=Candidatus Magasanikbacteria bacterium RIFCSPHIGHO2_02_FULL_47_14 TaxID=1798680 RepID=A0A1F6M771_9BACT|nr:MAG: DoxX family protein [Candidatus Magasanikbacteria bacterium RIFCSPHIGHO2_02_FULL_47_14]
MDFLFLLGRVIYGGFFIMNGLSHVMKSDSMVGYAQSKGVKSPKMMIVFSGLLILLGGLGILLGVYIQISVLFIGLFLVIVSFKMHNFWKATDPQAKMMDMIQFNKNMALFGAGLMFLQIPQPWIYSV